MDRTSSTKSEAAWTRGQGFPKVRIIQLQGEINNIYVYMYIYVYIYIYVCEKKK